MLFSSFSYDLLILTILFLEVGVVWTTRVLIGRSVSKLRGLCWLSDNVFHWIVDREWLNSMQIRGYIQSVSIRVSKSLSQSTVWSRYFE